MPPTPIQQQVILNFAAKIDQRTNNEILDIDPNSDGMVMYNLINGDNFFTKSLTVRQGVIDLCGGVINASGAASLVYNLYSGTGSINGIYPRPVYMEPVTFDREGNIINFGSQSASGISTFSLYGGKILLQDTSASGTIVEAGYDVEIQMYLAPISGIGLTNPSQFTDTQHGQIHSTALSGNFNTNYNAPSLINIGTQPTDPTPLAISLPTIVNFGPASQYTNISGTYQTPWLTVPWQLSAPFQFSPNTPYYLYIVANNTSGISNRGLNVQTIYGNNDIQLNVMYANLFLSLVSGNSYPNVLRQYEGVIPVSGTKSWLAGEIDQYNSPSYSLVDYPYVTTLFSSPISGTANNPLLGFQDQQNYQSAQNSNPFPGLNQSPTVSTTAAEFGEAILLPSGTYNVNGAYIYANIFSNTNWNIYNTQNQTVNPNGYNLNYIFNMYQVFGTNGNYLETNLLSSYQGNYTFNSPNSYQNPYFNVSLPGAGINNGLEKIYSIFPNPPTITTDGSIKYLFSWQWLNPATNLPLTDYEVITQTNAGNYYDFSSPILLGQTGNGASGFYRKEALGFIGYSGNTINLAMGVISFPSGNAITGIYDYRVGDQRSQAVIYTQNSDLGYFELATPKTLNVIYKNGPIGDNYKWSFSTFQDLLFAHPYAIQPGVCWDQNYSTNPISGTYGDVQLHGLQPVFSGVGVNLSGVTFPQGVPGIASSGVNFNVIIASSILSGGIRASEILSVSGTNFASNSNAFQIYGVSSPTNDATYPYDIYHVPGLAAGGIVTSGQSQYKFDVFSNGTYVFTSQVSGTAQNSTYFLAPLCDSKGNPYPNPIPDNNSWNEYAPYYSGTVTSGTAGSGVYIYNIQYSGINSLQVPNIINFGQQYLLSQVRTPKFKYMMVLYGLLLGIGDPENPSRLWYSDINAPQIWGSTGATGAGASYGYYDIDVDNGQELTGMGVYKGYLILFKENTTYSAQYTSTAGSPFSIQQIDPNKGNLGVFATVSTSYGVFGLSQFGPVLATFYGCETIADEILPYFENLSREDLIYSVAIHDVARQQIYWSIADSSESPNNQTALIYSYATKSWCIRQNGLWNYGAIVGDVDNFNQLIIGDTYGQIKKINSGIYEDDILFVDVNDIQLNQSVTLEFETPWMNFGGNSTQLKQAKTLRINCENSNQMLAINVYYDQNETAPAYTRFLDMSQPVWNRVVSLAGIFRTVKFVISNFGTADMVKINSMQLSFMNRGQNTNQN